MVTAVIVTSVTVVVGTTLPRCTETPLVNSATYHFTATAPVVPLRVKVTVVELVICPVTCPLTGSTESSATLKTRNAFVVSTAVIVAVAELAVSANVAVPDWTALITAACTGAVHRSSGRHNARTIRARLVVTSSRAGEIQYRLRGTSRGAPEPAPYRKPFSIRSTKSIECA
ncbi:MAG TPA: hypothetical protein VGK30_10790 [Candidatus Binatia bacterium]|jgi:hypothetical protein